MEITSVSLTNFKSYPQASLQLHPKFNCFTGLNGSGKTNLLDAIYTLCFAKSFFRQRDLYLIHGEEPFYRLEGRFLGAGGESAEVVLKYPRGGRKALEKDGKRYKRYSDHIGKFPVVMIAPGDDQAMISSSAERRRHIDQTLSQIDASYLEKLLTFNRLLKQRNALLRNARAPAAIGQMLGVYDSKMEGPAEAIYGRRKEFIDEWEPQVLDYYDRLSGGAEHPRLTYRSQLAEADFLSLMGDRRQKDAILQRTTGGIHRDDIEFGLGRGPLKTYGSQGQKKSFLLALKLAQYDYLHRKLQNRPLLLLDDIFDKLDGQRVHQLLGIISEDPFGQVFLTDTDAGRLEDIFSRKRGPVRTFLRGPGRGDK